jgi:hypothetical protein
MILSVEMDRNSWNSYLFLNFNFSSGRFIMSNYCKCLLAVRVAFYLCSNGIQELGKSPKLSQQLDRFSSWRNCALVLWRHCSLVPFRVTTCQRLGFGWRSLPIRSSQRHTNTCPSMTTTQSFGKANKLLLLEVTKLRQRVATLEHDWWRWERSCVRDASGIFKKIIRWNLLILDVEKKFCVCKRRESDNPESQTPGKHFSYQCRGRYER